MSKIYQGTTAENIFILPFAISSFQKLKITYRQGENIVHTKYLTDEGVSFEGNTIKVHFTQMETFYFDDKRELEIQIRGKTVDGEVAESEPIITTVGECFDREVL